MHGTWQSLHAEMVVNIEGCWQLSLSETEQLEAAFEIAYQYWEELSRQLHRHRFKSAPEEVEFYRDIKPPFTAWLEYLTLLYSAQIIKPVESIREYRFWEKEEKRKELFVQQHAAFVAYYEQGDNSLDLQYFMTGKEDKKGTACLIAYDKDSRFITQQDHLVALILAQNLYHRFIIKKLASLKQAMENE